MTLASSRALLAWVLLLLVWKMPVSLAEIPGAGQAALLQIRSAPSTTVIPCEAEGAGPVVAACENVRTPQTQPFKMVDDDPNDSKLWQRPRLMTWNDLEHYKKLVKANQWDTTYPHELWFFDGKVPGLGGGDATLKWGFDIEMAFTLGAKEGAIGLNVGGGNMPHGRILAPHVAHMMQTDFSMVGDADIPNYEVISGDWYKVTPSLLMHYQGKVDFVFDSCAIIHFRPEDGLNKLDPFRNGCYSVGKTIFLLLKQGGNFFFAADVSLDAAKRVNNATVGTGYGENLRNVSHNKFEEWEEFMHPEDLLGCYQAAGLELVGDFTDRFNASQHYNFNFGGTLGVVAAIFRKP